MERLGSVVWFCQRLVHDDRVRQGCSFNLLDSEQWLWKPCGLFSAFLNARIKSRQDFPHSVSVAGILWKKIFRRAKVYWVWWDWPLTTDILFLLTVAASVFHLSACEYRSFFKSYFLHVEMVYINDSPPCWFCSSRNTHYNCLFTYNAQYQLAENT